jgi:hypothetical protein
MTLKDMTHQQVIMHRLGRNLGDGFIGHLDIREMFRRSGLDSYRPYAIQVEAS